MRLKKRISPLPALYFHIHTDTRATFDIFAILSDMYADHHTSSELHRRLWENITATQTNAQRHLRSNYPPPVAATGSS